MYTHTHTHIDTSVMHISGAVIVGSVDGNRLWGKELKMQLKFCEWSPGKPLALTGAKAQILIFSCA